ncbi:right-handed parallel beta-helix repeat-containing protein, partial [Methanobrevibacter sp.]|uniref:right-handed parallel beta-helix repeat-containing protein n=1 Tax=Methanobrevibacter sp. TaxID=66852 RepID=UPI0025F92CF4
MKKKTIGILLIMSLVMIMCIGAISAADTNDTLQAQISDTDTATEAVALEDNVTSLESEAGSDVEINANDNSDEISDGKVKAGASSNAGEEVLSASDDDLLGENPNFYYAGKWYGDLDDAVDDACDNNGGTIYLKARAWGYDSAEREITISDGVWLTFQPYNSGDEVIFDGQKNTYWFFKIDDKDAHITFNDITFRNGGDGSLASDGGAIRIIHGSVTFNNCIFDNNEAGKNIAGGFGWGGAIFLDESDASLIANNCRFTNNKADNGGGAVCAEDDASATFNNCYFEGNTAPDGNNVLDKDGGSHTFNNCRFIGSGSLDIVVDAPAKTVHITPDVNDDVNYAVLYKGGNYYDRKPCNDGDTATFSNLERGTYTVYMMKNWEAKYEYSGNAFSIMEPNFVLDGDKVFETLSAAVNAIPNGGTGEITVEGGIYTGSANFNVQIINKRVTICPKDTNNPVTFSGSSQSYLFDVGSNAQLTMEDITITGKFSDIALKFLTNQVCTISDCEFKNIKNTNNQPERPIFAQNSNLVLSGDTFESSSRIVFGNTVVKIDDCTFTSNVGINGGAIYADSSSDVTITNSKFTDNEGTGSGGAIYANKLKIHDTTFMGNSANRGGAIYIASGSNDLVNITNCVFDYNYATNGYRNIYSESTTRKINLQFNEYDLNLKIDEKDGSYGMDYILDGVFDWGSNLDNNYTVLAGIRDDENLFGDLLTIKDNQFKISMGVLSGGTHEFAMEGMYTQGDSNDHFYLRYYYSDLYGNEFYLNKAAYAKIVIEKAKIILTLDVKDVLIPETPVLNVRANWDNNYTIIIGNKNYQLEVVNGKASMPLTGLDLGNYTVVGMRDGDVNYYMVMNFTTFSISKTYSNFLVLSTNVEYDTLKEAVANSNNEDSIFIKNGTYKETGIVISDKTLDIIALEGAVFDAQGGDANFITVNKNAGVYICGITFRGLHNRNTNYGAIVNHGDLSLDSCNFTDNKITKTSFAQNGGAAIFSDGESLDIDNCNFINNVAPLKVSTAAVTSVGYEDVSIASSNFINNSAREGGALHFKNISQFESAVSSCEFEQNTAVKGSAIYVGNNSRYLSVTLSSFKKNDIKNSLGENAQLEGGVIYVNANTSEVIFDVSLSNFEDNSNRQVDGGVICLDGISRANIESSIFSNNNGKLGSVILIKNPQDKKLFLSIDSSGFIDNHATNGAIATSPKVTTFIDECLFANNTGENRHIYSNGFTIVHDSIFEVRDAKLNALSVQYGESSTINGTVDIGTNIYATANLTIANENTFVEIKNNTFSYKTGILDRGKYSATLNGVVDANGNTYLMESITEIFRVNAAGFDLNVSVDNITYGETLTVVENLPQTVTGTVDYQLNGRYYTKEEIESLILDAGKYTLVAIYNHEDYSFASSTVNFEVYKANPTITVDDVEVEYGDNIILKIESNVPSIYTIEIEDYKTAVFVNGSRSVKIEKTFEPGDYTVKVTSQERVNYKSNSTEANLKVNVNSHALMLSVSDKTAHPDESLIKVSALDNAAGDITYTVSDSNKNIVYTMTQSCSEDLTISGLDAGTYEIKAVLERNGRPLMTSNNLKLNLNNENIRISPDDNKLGEDYGEGKFIFQYDEDSDYEYYDTLEEAIDEVVTWGAGIITVRGGIYSGDGFRDIVLEGELELTIKAFEGEEVIFDCGNEGYFLHLTYETEVYPIETPPFIETEQTEGPTVTLDKITVIRGSAINGGAIDLDAGTLILANCTFSNNNAACGGAIYIGSSSAENEATVMVYNTTFTNNTASEGGAIYIEGGLLQDVSATFYLCTFLDNYQGEEGNYTLNYFGGADVNEITKQYCIFNGVGEIYSVVIDKINQTVTVNGTSPDVFDSVVLLYFDQAPLYSIYNNGSRDFYVTFEDVIGGNYTLGVMNDHDFNTYIFENKFEMKVPNFIISEDEVYENLTDAIDAVAENGIIYANANYYTEDNMEIVINKSFTLKNFRDRDVVFDGCGEKWFFTIAEGKTVVFDGIYFTDGGVKGHASIENYGTLIINNCSFESFETGEIIYNSGLLNILNTTFSMNSVNDALVWNDKDLFIDTVEFSYNIVNTSSVVYTNGVAEIISSNFTDNFNLGNGGAINNAKSLSVKDTVFNENEGLDGGAIYSTGILEVLNCTFEDNTANGYGGAIYNGGEANIFNSTFTGASSEKDGGAIYNNDKLAVDNSTFVGDTATGNGGAIYNNKSSVITKSLFGINFAEECANIYNAGDIQFSDNIFDFYDVILIVPDGEYGIPTTITGTLNPEFNMDIQVLLPGFVNNKDASVIISDGVFEYVTDILPRGTYDVILDEVIYDGYGNIYYGEAITDRLIIHKANVYINLTVDDVVIRGETGSPVLKISASKDGLVNILFNNKFSNVTITGGQATVTLDAVGEGKYSVLVVREGDENYNDAANQTTFKVSKYEGNFIVNSTGNQFETLREALADTSNDDVIYVMEGTYSSADNLGLTISNKKLTIISLGDVVFDANSTDLRFLTVDKTADVTLCDVVLIGFNAKNKEEVILNKGNFTFDGCTITKYNWVSDAGGSRFIDSEGNLNIIDSEFYDNVIYTLIHATDGEVIINGSEFENNTIKSGFISLHSLNSAKIISNVFAENIISEQDFLFVSRSKDVFINSEFYNNQCDYLILAYSNTNMLVNNSIFIGNTVKKILRTNANDQSIISESVFTNNTAENVVLSSDKKLSVLESTFSDNTLSDNGALNIASGNAIVNGSIFSNNKANNYRNIYSASSNVNITNSVFDALNVDYTVYDIDYGQTETIEGSIDIGTNLKFAVNLDINNKIYSVNVTNNGFTFNSGVLNGGDYNVVLNPKDNNSNTFVFDKITKIFTVKRVDPGLSISIADITEGEKLKVNMTISKNITARVVYELNGNTYNKNQLENLTLKAGNYLITAMYRGDKNYLAATDMVNVKVHKIAPNITVSDAVVNYTDEIKINVTVDVADYYTVFIGNESVSLYVKDNATFTFPSEEFKPGSYEIIAYVFESDDYAEAYGYANLTVNKAATGVFNLSDDLIDYGENATISVEVPVNAYGNIAYKVYDENMELVYNITQSCLDELVVPNLRAGRYTVTGAFEGDSYYTNDSTVNSGVIYVNPVIAIIVSDITYGENVTVTIETDIDGEYLVYVGNESNVVTVKDGVGNVTVSDLTVGSYVVNVTAVDGNYSAFNETVFDVALKSISAIVSVGNIIYGEEAIVTVYGEVDGEYIVEIYNQNYTVNVADGKGNTTISDLVVGEDILASVSIADGNYSAYNTTTFNVVPKQIPVIISVGDTQYGEDALVTVQADVDGDYTVNIRDVNYTVSVDGGKGVKLIHNLDVGEDILASVSIADGNYSAYNTTTFNVILKKNTTIDAVAKVNGNKVTVTVTVDENATGYIGLTQAGLTMFVALENGVATYTDTVPAGSYNVEVTYTGDYYFNENSTRVLFTVVEFTKDNTPISIDVSTVENNVTYTVNVNHDASGIVRFEVSGAAEYVVYADVLDGVAVMGDVLEAGDYTVVATYMGDNRFNTNVTLENFTVKGHVKKDTPISASASVNGNKVTITVTVDENATGFIGLTESGSTFYVALV